MAHYLTDWGFTIRMLALTKPVELLKVPILIDVVKAGLLCAAGLQSWSISTGGGQSILIGSVMGIVGSVYGSEYTPPTTPLSVSYIKYP